MTDQRFPFGWPSLHHRIEDARQTYAQQSEPLLWYVGPATEFCKRIIGPGRSPANGSRPQDHVAVGVAIHAFRSALASIELCVGGFADAAAPINRSVWEMQLRLFDVRQTGMLGALACLLYEAETEIAAREFELANGWHTGDEATGALEAWVAWRDELHAKATAAGFTSKDLARHGKLPFGATATEAQQLGSYKTLYARHSLTAHGSRSSTMYTNLSAGGLFTEEGAPLLPLDAYVVDMIGDVLTQLFLSFSYAAEIINDPELADDVLHALRHLQDEWVRISPYFRHGTD
jgi:hypothetical protein